MEPQRTKRRETETETEEIESKPETCHCEFHKEMVLYALSVPQGYVENQTPLGDTFSVKAK